MSKYEFKRVCMYERMSVRVLVSICARVPVLVSACVRLCVCPRLRVYAHMHVHAHMVHVCLHARENSDDHRQGTVLEGVGRARRATGHRSETSSAPVLLAPLSTQRHPVGVVANTWEGRKWLSAQGGPRGSSKG